MSFEGPARSRKKSPPGIRILHAGPELDSLLGGASITAPEGSACSASFSIDVHLEKMLPDQRANMNSHYVAQDKRGFAGRTPVARDLRLKYMHAAEGRVMLVFVDESGDTGFRFDSGSSEYFTVTLAIFADHNAASSCDEAISQLRHRSGRRRDREYRFSSCNHSTRLRFLGCVAEHKFEYASIVINKRNLYGKGFRHKAPFIKCAMKYVFNNVAHKLKRAKVVVDSTGDRDFQRTLQSYLKREIRPDGKVSPIVKVESKPSHRDNLIQLVDMVCGSVARAQISGPKHTVCYREIIKKRELGIQFWPV